MQHKYTIKNISRHGTCVSKAHSLKNSQLTNIAVKISFLSGPLLSRVQSQTWKSRGIEILSTEKYNANTGCEIH